MSTASQLLEQLIASDVVVPETDSLRLDTNYRIVLNRRLSDPGEEYSKMNDIRFNSMSNYNISETKIQEAKLRFSTIIDTLDDYVHLKKHEKIKSALLVDQLWRGQSDNRNQPRSFLPVNDFQALLITDMLDKVVLYIWVEKSDYCSSVEDTLNKLMPNYNSELVFTSMYAPDNPEILREAWDVGITPTVLFFNNGEIFTRLVGPKHEVAFKSEIEKLRSD